MGTSFGMGGRPIIDMSFPGVGQEIVELRCVKTLTGIQQRD